MRYQKTGVALASRRNNSVKMEHQVEEEVRGEKGPTSSSSIGNLPKNWIFILLYSWSYELWPSKL